MLNTTESFDTSIKKYSRNIKVKISFPNMTLEGTEIKDISITNNLLTGEEFEIGTFITSIATVTILNEEVYQSLEGKECNIYVGAITSAGTEYINMGIYKVTKETIKDQLVTLEMEDRTSKFDKEFKNITYPATLKQIAESVCNQVGVNLNGDFYNSSYKILEDPKLEEGTTCRSVIAAVAELTGGYARINPVGKLEFFNLEKPSNLYCFSGDENLYASDDGKINSGSLDKILIDRNMYYSLDIAKNETETITKVSIMTDNIYSSKGNDNGKNYVIDNNILITTHENKELLTSIYNKLVGLSYKSINMKWQGNPSYQIGDNVTIYDGKVFHNTYIMSRKLTFNGGLTEEYSASGKSKEEDSTQVQGTISQQVKRANVQIDFMNKQIEMRVKEDDLETIVTQNAESWNLSINGKLKGTNYNFDGEGMTITNGDITVKNEKDETVMWVDDETGLLSVNALEVFGDGGNTVNFHGNGGKAVNFRSDDNKSLFLNFYRGQSGSEDANPRIGIYAADNLSDRSNQLWVEPSGKNGGTPMVIIRGRDSTIEVNEKAMLQVIGEIQCVGDLTIKHGDNTMNVLTLIQNLQEEVAELKAKLNS